MRTRLHTCVALTVMVLCMSTTFAQEPPEDPFNGGFAVNQETEIFTMGMKNDSLQGWGFDWFSDQDSILLLGTGLFPESYQCGEDRDIAAADFDGDFLDELVVAWNRADGGIFVGIPTIDPVTMVPDPAGWRVPDPPIAVGVLHATDTLAEVLGEIRVVAGNFPRCMTTTIPEPTTRVESRYTLTPMRLASIPMVTAMAIQPSRCTVSATPVSARKTARPFAIWNRLTPTAMASATPARDAAASTPAV